MPLKSRRLFPPGMWQWFQPETGWRAPVGLDFDSVVNEIIRHRRANPRFGLRVDWDGVADELDLYTCKRIGNNPQYCISEDEAKKRVRPSQAAQLWRGVANVAGASKRVVVGIGVLLDWLGSGGKAVLPALAASRAEVCSTCPQNSQQDLTSFFTVPASEMIRKQLEIKNDMKLATPLDDKIGVCVACACPLKTKVWTPIKHVLKILPSHDKERLDPRCWILKEANETQETAKQATPA